MKKRKGEGGCSCHGGEASLKRFRFRAQPRFAVITSSAMSSLGGAVFWFSETKGGLSGITA